MAEMGRYRRGRAACKSPAHERSIHFSRPSAPCNLPPSPTKGQARATLGCKSGGSSPVHERPAMVRGFVKIAMPLAIPPNPSRRPTKVHSLLHCKQGRRPQHNEKRRSTGTAAAGGGRLAAATHSQGHPSQRRTVRLPSAAAAAVSVAHVACPSAASSPQQASVPLAAGEVDGRVELPIVVFHNVAVPVREGDGGEERLGRCLKELVQPKRAERVGVHRLTRLVPEVKVPRVQLDLVERHALARLLHDSLSPEGCDGEAGPAPAGWGPTGRSPGAASAAAETAAWATGAAAKAGMAAAAAEAAASGAGPAHQTARSPSRLARGRSLERESRRGRAATCATG
eukprot:scaffold1748_cov123-Isochrysis_galbana.AAC.4